MSKKTAVLVLMIAAAIITVIAGVSVSKNISIKKNGISAESTVLKSERNSKGNLKNVTVSFKTIEGVEVTAEAATRKDLNRDDKMSIWYDKGSPQRITFGDLASYNMRGVVIGGLLFLFGLYYFIRFSLNDSSDKRLIKTGKKISAEFVSVDREVRYNMGDKNPWSIRCKWVDTGNSREYYFKSKDYIIDPAPYLGGRHQIDVFIDEMNPEKFYMDTSFMPKGNNTIG